MDLLKTAREIIAANIDAGLGDRYQEAAEKEVIEILQRNQPRCDQCARWDPRGDAILDGETGFCGLRETADSKMWPEMYDGIVTTKDFGCAQWKAK